MRAVEAGLNETVVGTYDQTKTSIFGRVSQKTAGGKTVLGPPLNRFIDTQTDFGVPISANGFYLTANGRIFGIGAEAGAATPLIMYSIDYATGAYVPVGRVNIILPDVAATTTVFRSIKVIDTGTTGWKVFITTTGSVLINGGTMLVNNLALSDFVMVGYPSIPFATGDDQKAVYFLQETGQMGSAHLQTASAGSVLHHTGNKLYVHNGVAATHQYYVFNTNVAPTWSAISASGVAATDVISAAGHPFVNGDQVIFPTLTGGAGLTALNTYFVVGSVAGVSFQVAVTSGGSAINFTTDISAATVGRAFGQTAALWSHKTGNLPALTGTLLLTDSEDYALPAHSALSGFDCAFFATSTQLYLGKLSELTAAATTWPSLATVNLLGTPNQIVVPGATYASWSNLLDKAIYSTGLVCVMKQFVNNSIDMIFAGTNNKYFEGVASPEVVELQPAAAITGMDVQDGWMAIMNATVGQRGLMITDLRSDAMFDYSYLISKVLDTPSAVYRFLTTVDALYDYTGSLDCYYRTSGFGSSSGGWTSIPFAERLNAYASGEQVQFKIGFATLGLDTCVPAQLDDLYLGFDSITENSLYWETSIDRSDNGNPSRTAFRLKKVYASSVPTLHYRALDLTNVELVHHTTAANASLFEYSTDSGATWSPLGTIPNTVGTMLRYTFAAAPGVDIRPSIREA